MPAVDGNRWKHRRAQLDITTDAAAPQLGISKRSLQNVETTAGYPVSLEVIYRAERLYGVSADWLMGGDEKPPTPNPEKPRREPDRDPDPKGPEPRKDRRGPKRVDLKAAS